MATVIPMIHMQLCLYDCFGCISCCGSRKLYDCEQCCTSNKTLSFPSISL